VLTASFALDYEVVEAFWWAMKHGRIIGEEKEKVFHTFRPAKRTRKFYA
jgi:hypothetical protein